MAEVIRMPRLSDTMEEGNIVGWQKKVGDTVSPGDILAEVETDKATMELESFNDGVLLHIGVPEGPVAVEGVIAIIGDAGEDISAILKQIEAEANAPKAEAPAATTPDPIPAHSMAAPKAPAPVAQPAAAAPSSSSDGNRIKVSPLAKKMAKDAGLDLWSLTGTGENGRIVKRDIESAIANGTGRGSAAGQATGASAAPMMMQATYDPSIYGDKPVSQMRKVIAKRLGQSKFSAPHFYLTMEIDMGAMIVARKAINEDAPIRISFLSLIHI